jgi:hypothetical protein
LPSRYVFRIIKRNSRSHHHLVIVRQIRAITCSIATSG